MAVKNKSKNYKFFNILKYLAIACLFIYAIFSLVSQQITIQNKRSEQIKLKEKVAIAQESNDKYNKLLNMTDKKVFMEQYAIDQLGYAYPNEKRYFDTLKK